MNSPSPTHLEASKLIDELVRSSRKQPEGDLERKARIDASIALEKLPGDALPPLLATLRTPGMSRLEVADTLSAAACRILVCDLRKSLVNSGEDDAEIVRNHQALCELLSIAESWLSSSLHDDFCARMRGSALLGSEFPEDVAAWLIGFPNAAISAFAMCRETLLRHIAGPDELVVSMSIDGLVYLAYHYGSRETLKFFEELLRSKTHDTTKVRACLEHALSSIAEGTFLPYQY